MTRLAQLMLVLTCLAPTALVWAAVQLEAGRFGRAGAAAGLAAVLLLVCHALLRGARKALAAVPKEIKAGEAAG